MGGVTWVEKVSLLLSGPGGPEGRSGVWLYFSLDGEEDGGLQRKIEFSAILVVR